MSRRKRSAAADPAAFWEQLHCAGEDEAEDILDQVSADEKKFAQAVLRVPKLLEELCNCLAYPGLRADFTWTGFHDKIFRLRDGTLVAAVLHQMDTQWRLLVAKPSACSVTLARKCGGLPLPWDEESVETCSDNIVKTAWACDHRVYKLDELLSSSRIFNEVSAEMKTRQDQR